MIRVEDRRCSENVSISEDALFAMFLAAVDRKITKFAWTDLANAPFDKREKWNRETIEIIR